MTCIIHVNGDYSILRDDMKLRMCSSEYAHQGALKRVKLPCAGTWVKEGEGIFRGILAGDYGS